MQRPHHAEVAMTEDGMATPRSRGPPLAHERQHRQRHEDTAENQVQVDLVQSGVDEARLVADDLELHVGRHLGDQPRQGGLLDALDNGHGVLARLPADFRITVGTPLRRAAERCSLVPSSA